MPRFSVASPTFNLVFALVGRLNSESRGPVICLKTKTSLCEGSPSAWSAICSATNITSDAKPFYAYVNVFPPLRPCFWSDPALTSAQMAGASITSDLHQQYGEGKSVVVVVPTPAHAWVPLRISSFLLGFDELSANFKSLPAEMLIATDDWVDACLARKALLPVQLGLAAVLPEGSVGSDGQFTGDDESSKSEKRCRLRIAVRPLDAPAHIRITSEARLFEWSKTKGMTQFIAHLHSLEVSTQCVPKK